MDELKGMEEMSAEAEAAMTSRDFETILALKQENEELKFKIAHLETLLAAATPILDERSMEITPEQVICEMQIKRLQTKAAERELSLEETKRLEILVKSLYLIKEKGGGEMQSEFATIPMGTSLASLAQLAATPDPQPEAD